VSAGQLLVASSTAFRWLNATKNRSIDDFFLAVAEEWSRKIGITRLAFSLVTRFFTRMILTVENFATNDFAIVGRHFLLGVAIRAANFFANVVQTVSFALTNRLTLEIIELLMTRNFEESQTTTTFF